MGLHWVVIWQAFPGGGTESDEKRNRVVVVLAEGLTREELEEKPMEPLSPQESGTVSKVRSFAVLFLLALS